MSVVNKKSILRKMIVEFVEFCKETFSISSEKLRKLLYFFLVNIGRADGYE